jgi:hypothetical protein
MQTFSLRLFLLNHSPVYSWEELPADVKSLFAPLNGSLARAECFVADLKHMRYYFEVAQSGQAKPTRHKADVVILQGWELITLVTYRQKNGRAPQSIGMLSTTIEGASFKGRKNK